MGKKKKAKVGSNADAMAEAIRQATAADIKRVTSSRPVPGRSSTVDEVLPRPKRRKGNKMTKQSKRLQKVLREALAKSDPAFDSPGNAGSVSPDEIDEMIRQLEERRANAMVTPGNYHGRIAHEEARVEKARGIALIARGQRAFEQLEKSVSEKLPVEATMDGSREQLARLGQAITLARLRAANGGA